MGISEAIARVRKGAKKARLEGALASVGASLGAGLQSHAIPPRLRPAASRIASLFGVPAEHARASSQPELPSLERQPGQAVPSSHGAMTGAASDVCPFTGLHADGTVGSEPQSEPAEAIAEGPIEASIAAPISESAPAQPVVLETKPEPAVVVAPQTVAEPVEVAASAASEHEAAPAVAKATTAAPVEARAQNKSKRAEPTSKPTAARAAGAEKTAPTEKAKEKLAAEPSVAKTSARSATKSAAKQTNGKANQRKK